LPGSLFVAHEVVDMESKRTSSSVKTIWTVLAIAITAVISFSGGYVLSSMTKESNSGLTVVDDYGRSVTLDGVPHRIVSIAPTPTEILYAIGAGTQMVGVDNYSDYPAEAGKLPKVGDAVDLNTEVIIALKPDVIFCGDLVPAQLTQLGKDQGIPYIILADRTMDDIYKTIRLAGIATGHVEQADELAANLSARVDAVTAKTHAANVSIPKVFVEYWSYGTSIYTFGPGSFGDDLISLAGGVNVAHNTSSEYPVVESEFVIAENPDIVIFTNSSTTKDAIMARDGWGNVTAVQTGHIYAIPDDLVSRYGPRIVDGLEQMAAMIHPELFP
jgi:iron complex transport system substrate-binding protein